MPMAYSKALDDSIEIKRVIDKIVGNKKGPTIIFTGGIHGNEPSGIFALTKVMRQLRESNYHFNGNVLALAGNLWALERGERYHKEDLNRLWTQDRTRQLENGQLKADNKDTEEQIELYDILRQTIEEFDGPFYFLDLHTTSAQTSPFMTVNDTILNRKFSSCFPLPIILGLEEYIEGPLLSYLNELGFVTTAYEAGQHDAMASIENHIAFIYLSLVYTGILAKNELEDYDTYHTTLAKTSEGVDHFFEIVFRKRIEKNEEFAMHPGYYNFQHIGKGEALASSDGQPIKSSREGRIFMPLYQGKGDDGFFIIQQTPEIFLNWSTRLRHWKFDHLLSLLPGITLTSERHRELIVDKRIARFLAKELFHLLGYRAIQINDKYLAMQSRDYYSRNADYSQAPWN